MKQLFFILAMVILVSANLFGQKMHLSKEDSLRNDDSGVPYGNGMSKIRFISSSKYFQMDHSDCVLRDDTLFIGEVPGFHFIKVDGKVFEIKRSTTLEEVKQKSSEWNGWQLGPIIERGTITPGLTLDSMLSIGQAIKN